LQIELKTVEEENRYDAQREMNENQKDAGEGDI